MTSFTPPPRAIRKAKLDNLALVPASLLLYKEQWQQLANELPAGTTLVVIPKVSGKAGHTLETVASQLQAKGQLVKIVPIGRIIPTFQ